MWVSKAKWEEMEKRLKALEDRKYDDRFTVYKKMDPMYMSVYSWHNWPSADITVKALVEKILEKLGMELAYIEGKPETVEMVKAKKAA